MTIKLYSERHAMELNEPRKDIENCTTAAYAEDIMVVVEADNEMELKRKVVSEAFEAWTVDTTAEAEKSDIEDNLHEYQRSPTPFV